VRQRLLWHGVEIAVLTVLEVPSSVLLLQGKPNAGVESGPQTRVRPGGGSEEGARRVDG